MPLILNIETATETCSVALSNKNIILDFRENSEGKSHASLLTVFIEDIMKTNNITAKDLDAVAVSMGPGSYTGLRIGVSVAKGICYGSSRPLIAVPTLQSMVVGLLTRYLNSADVIADSWLCPMIDARRLEVYTSFYNSNFEEKSTTKAEIINDTSFQQYLNERKIIFFGNGSTKCAEIIKHSNASFYNDFKPSACDMMAISEKLFYYQSFQNVAYFEPYYLKDFVSTTPKNKIF